MKRRAEANNVLLDRMHQCCHFPTADPAPKAAKTHRSATFPIYCFLTFDLPIPMFPRRRPF